MKKKKKSVNNSIKGDRRTRPNKWIKTRGLQFLCLSRHGIRGRGPGKCEHSRVIPTGVPGCAS